MRVDPISFILIKSIEGAVNGTRALKRKKIKKKISDRIEYIKVLQEGGLMSRTDWVKEHNELAAAYNKILEIEKKILEQRLG